MKDVSSFDLRGDAERGAWLQLLDPITGEELGVVEDAPMRIKLQGADSMAYEEAIAHSVAVRGRKNKPKVNPTAAAIRKAAQENAKSQSEELAKITLAWENIGYGEDDEGNIQPLEFNRKNAIMLYHEQGWIREQAINFFGDRVNFAGKD